MRRGAEIFVVVFGLYCAGFAFVRWHFHSSDTVWLPNAAGTDYNAPIQQERTFIWIPGTGAERPAKQTLFGCSIPQVSLIGFLLAGFMIAPTRETSYFRAQAGCRQRRDRAR